MTLNKDTFEIVTLRTGGKSLRSLQTGQTFHPGIGPVEEARILHVEQQRLAERCDQRGHFVLWDVGFGAAANALTAIEALAATTAMVEIHSFDFTLAPIEFALNETASLTYLAPHRKLVETLLAEGQVQVSKNIRWHFHFGDFLSVIDRPLAAPNGIFYDPYSPTKNPGMWTLSHFTRLRSKLAEECLLTTYSRSTAVRVTLLMAGFFVGAGRTLGEKAETTVASSRLEDLEQPLKADWFLRVKASNNAAPFRGSEFSLAPISGPDFAELESHSQFAIN
jgi:tRNA U34 5-methylaminomethyl-2-thiouridine-forming methyltransferase MnmC